jgi:long-chain acyl-CoA synthetase
MQDRPWLATYREFGIPADIGPHPHGSVTAMLETAMSQYASQLAFVSFGERLTYADVDRLSRDFAAYLQAQGIQRGDRIAVMTPNLLAFPVAMLGIVRAGAVQVNVNPLYTPRELAHQLQDSGAETIVIFNGSTGTLAEVIDQTPVRQIITVGLGLSADSPLPSPPVDPRLPQPVTLIEALEKGGRMGLKPVTLGAEDLLFLQYTGGTTGLSKGAALTHGNLMANCRQFGLFMPDAMRPGQEVVVTAIPLYHIFALMVNFIHYFSLGAENWLVANPRDMDGFVETLRQARPTVFTGVNTLFAGLTMHPRIAEVDWSRLRLVGGGGAAIVPAVSSRWQAITGQFIREGYGLSETSPVVSFNPAAVLAFTGTTGLPMPSCDVMLVGDDGNEVERGGSGEICVKGPQVMQGYWNKPEANDAAFTAAGYFRTGDVGLFDAKGFLKIVDRKKDMILVSGFNVYPNEVEAVVSACDGVAECACVGLPDDRSGEKVALFVVPRAGAQVTVEDVLAYCRVGLAPYKVPTMVQFVEGLPKSSVGKILRRELRTVPATAVV